MEKSINLLPKKGYAEKKLSLIKYLVDVASAFFILLFAVVALVFVQIDYSKTQNLKSLQANDKNIKDSINADNAVTTELINGQNLINQYKTINSSTFNQLDIINYLKQKIYTSITLTNYQYSGATVNSNVGNIQIHQGNSISLNAVGLDYMDLSKMIVNISNNTTGNQHIRNINVSNIDRDSKTNQITVKFTFNYI